jgi:ribose 5-phosphate isomerase B
MQTPIALGCDEAAFRLKAIRAYLEKLGHTVEDFGVYNTDPSLYPDIAEKAARAVADGRHSQGILMCGTGIGMAITADKVPGVPRISKTEGCSSRDRRFSQKVNRAFSNSA